MTISDHSGRNDKKETNMRNRTATRTRVAATAAVLAGAALMLAGCGGNSVDGDYFNEYGVMQVDGSEVSFFEFNCDSGSVEGSLEEEPEARGTLNDDKTQIMWEGESNYLGPDVVKGTMSFVVSEFDDTNSVRINDDNRLVLNTGDEEAIQAAYAERCD